MSGPVDTAEGRRLLDEARSFPDYYFQGDPPLLNWLGGFDGINTPTGYWRKALA